MAQSMDSKSKNKCVKAALEVKAETDACLKGEISCPELQRRIYPRLRCIEALRRVTQNGDARKELDSSAEPESDLENNSDNCVDVVVKVEQFLLGSLRSLVERLRDAADPLNDLYVIGAQIFDDFQEVISEEEYDKLLVFREFAHQQAVLLDEDSHLETATAAELRRQIRDAASTYLFGARDFSARRSGQ
jgi:hypothetical protein